jgi:hypothetical protein
LLLTLPLGAQRLLKGVITESDSITTMPFVYVISKATGHGTMSDQEGKFILAADNRDTLLISYIGYFRQSIPVSSLPDNNARIMMTEMPYKLKTVTISAFKFKDYERDYMNDIIDRSRLRTIDYALSPFSALYARYSKEGRQIRKLAKIFEDLIIEEQVQQKLSRETVIKLTGDEKLDYDAFRKYCYYVSNEYIISHEGAELYLKVLECYKNYKAEMRR